MALARADVAAPATAAGGAYAAGGARPARLRRAGRLGLEGYGRATASLRPLPDFVVVGSQRCGTTSLWNYLLASPAVAGPRRRKGVHYFSKEYHRGLPWYRSHFPTAAYRRFAKARSGVDLVVGEAAPYYVFHPLAPERLAAAMPDAKLVLMLRDPVERAYSQYQHERARGFEHLTSFEEALEAEPERLAGEAERMRADEGYLSVHWERHSYVAKGRYAEQIERLHSLFPPERLLVVQSEEFFSSPEAELRQVTDHLGVAPVTLPAYARHNGYTYADMPPAARRRLVEHFAEPNARLFDLLGRRFAWTS